jgi:hypothetical protein
MPDDGQSTAAGEWSERRSGCAAARVCERVRCHRLKLLSVLELRHVEEAAVAAEQSRNEMMTTLLPVLSTHDAAMEIASSYGNCDRKQTRAIDGLPAAIPLRLTGESHRLSVQEPADGESAAPLPTTAVHCPPACSCHMRCCEVKEDQTTAIHARHAIISLRPHDSLCRCYTSRSTALRINSRRFTSPTAPFVAVTSSTPHL